MLGKFAGKFRSPASTEIPASFFRYEESLFNWKIFTPGTKERWVVAIVNPFYSSAISATLGSSLTYINRTPLPSSFGISSGIPMRDLPNFLT